MSEVQPGFYRHWKGFAYEVLGTATHAETDEVLVVYRPVRTYDAPWWLRPLRSFEETVELPGGSTVPRFERMEEPRRGA